MLVACVLSWIKFRCRFVCACRIRLCVALLGVFLTAFGLCCAAWIAKSPICWHLLYMLKCDFHWANPNAWSSPARTHTRVPGDPHETSDNYSTWACFVKELALGLKPSRNIQHRIYKELCDLALMHVYRVFLVWWQDQCLIMSNRCESRSTKIRLRFYALEKLIMEVSLAHYLKAPSNHDPNQYME